MYDIKPTYDYGFILAGSSLSQTKDQVQSGMNYLVWKLKEDGSQEWQRSFKGLGSDHLYSINLTREGGFILGGSSNSDKGLHKKSACLGLNDFWIIKLAPDGREEWQRTIGGKGNEELLSITQTQDGGYILGGTSNSPTGLIQAEKQEQQEVPENQQKLNSYGNSDFFLVKLDAKGQIEWTKTIGGKYIELLRSIHQTQEGGYIIGGYSTSPPSGNKTAEFYGYGDYWVVKLNEEGVIEWQRSYGGKQDDQLFDLKPTPDGGFIMGGNSNSASYGEKQASNGEGTDYWVLKLDNTGAVEWDTTLDFGQWDVMVSVLPNKAGEYLISGYSQNQQKEDYILAKLNNQGQQVWDSVFGGEASDKLMGSIQSRDGGYVLAGTSNSPKSNDKQTNSQGQNDFWVLKIQDNENPVEDDIQTRIQQGFVEAYPNPTNSFSNILIQKDFTTARADVYNLNGQLVMQQNLKYRTSAINLARFEVGVYIIKVTVDGETNELKIIKK